MILSDTCIKRPVFATVLTLIIVVIGIVSFTRLTVREYPNIDEPVVTVSTTYPGASAEVIESRVTKPLEDQIAGIEGVRLMTSSSRAERSQITVAFELTRDADAAAAEVRDKVSRARRALPDDVDEPVIAKVEADSRPVIFMAVRAGELSPMEVTDYMNRFVLARLSVLPGAAEVRLYGAREPSMRINVDRQQLAAYNLTVQDIESALRAQNVEIPAGRIESDAREFSVVSATNLNTPEEFRNIVVANVQGYPVRLGELANVQILPLSERRTARFNGTESLNLGIVKQSTANPLDLSVAVREEVERINETLPAGMELVISYDTSIFIERSIQSVYKTIGEAMLLVALTIFFFLRTIRASLIPLVTIPVSLIGAFSFLYLFGFSINTLTLLAMVLAIGLVVDDAIVVLENTYRHIENGLKPIDAAIKGTREIAFAVIAMTLTLVTVYAPLAFATGRTGRLFIEFAIALSSAVLVSGFVALTLTPVMCSRLLKHEKKHGAIYNAIERFLQGMTRGYRSTLTTALHYRWVVVLIGLAFAASSVLFFTNLKSELAPVEDRGVIFGVISAPEGATLGYTAANALKVDDLYADIPEAAARQLVIGFPNVTDGFAILRLKNWEDRERSQQEIANELFPKFMQLPGIRAFPTNPPSFGLRATSRPIEFVVMSQVPYAELYDMVNEFMDALRPYPGLGNVDTDLRMNTPELRVEVDRDKLADLGIDVANVGRTLETMLGGRQVTRFELDGEQYQVVVQVEPTSRNEPSDISGIYVRARDGGMVQLANVASVQETVAPQSLNHFNRLRAVKVQANIMPGYTMSEVLDHMFEVAQKTFPSNVQFDLDGQSREYKEASVGIYMVFGMALVLIYLVLAAQFESWRNPLIIMLTVPLAMTGALAALYFTGGTLSIYSQIGLVTLVGVITKHGILIVEFATQLRQQGQSMMEAITEASVLRLRPILMTAGTMILGAAPLAYATGAGAESREQIGWVLVGGMTLGTIMTLYVIPVAYSLLATRKVRSTIDTDSVDSDTESNVEHGHKDALGHS